MSAQLSISVYVEFPDSMTIGDVRLARDAIAAAVDSALKPYRGDGRIGEDNVRSYTNLTMPRDAS
jgi:hypothetical protein